MRTGTVSYKLEDLRKGVIIPIGMVGENDFTRVIFDAEEVFKKHPDAQVTMKVQPPKGGIYPATVSKDGNAVIWQVKAADVAHRGSGELQLTFTADTMVEKSYIAKTDIKRSLVGNGPAPDPVQDWLDEAQEALEDIESAEVHQPIIGNDGYWYTWNQETGEYEKTDTKAQGQDGHSPVLTSSKSGKTTTLYADGEQIAQIQDGEDGQGADVIDDTAGEGDTDKTWSADKLDEELTDVKTEIDGFSTATASDVGKALSPKTVADGKVTEWQFVEGGGGGSVDLPIKPQDILASKIVRNLFNPYTAIPGYMINKTTGELAVSAQTTASDFIEIEPGTLYAGNNGRFAWYTENKTFISGGDTLNETAPVNAKYLRVDRQTSTLSALSIYKYAYRGTADNSEYKIELPYLAVKPDLKPDDFDKYGATFVNKFNKHKATDGYYVNNSSGTFSSNSSYFISEYIPVKPSTTYKMTYGNRYAAYDKDFNYISGENKSSNPATFTTPSNAAYVVICGTPLTRKDEMIFAEESLYPAGYESYGVIVPWIKPMVAKSKYDGKTLVCFGDSITFGDYTETIKADTGINAINQGYSSARWAYADDASATVNAFAMHELIKALTTDDWTTPDTIIGVSGYESQASQLAALKQIDFSKVDFVSFSCGTNDFSSATPLDNPSDPYDTEYVMGAVRYCIKTLLTAYPHLKIICATPCYRFWIENNAIVDDCDTHQIGGMLLKDVCEAIEEASTDCHVPYVNNLKNAGINAFNRSNYFYTTDGLHPNVAGRAILGHRIGSAILNEL